MNGKNGYESKEELIEMEVNSILRGSSSILRSPIQEYNNNNIIHEENELSAESDDINKIFDFCVGF